QLDQRLARLDHREIRLRSLAAMADRVQQRGVHADQAGQVLGVKAVALPARGEDQANLAGIGDVEFVTGGFENTTDPGAVRTNFDRNAARQRNQILERLRFGWEGAAGYDFA